MKENDGNNDRNNSEENKKVSVSGNLSVEFDPTGISEISKAIREKEAGEGIATNRSAVIAERQNQIAERANRISNYGNWIGAFALLFTFVIIIMNLIAVNAAVDSVKEVQKQFKAQHQSFLQIARVDTANFKSYDSTNISYEIQNLGTDPAKIQTAKFAVVPGKEDSLMELLIQNKDYAKALLSMYRPPIFVIDSSIYNRYATKESPIVDKYVPKMRLKYQALIATTADTSNRLYFFGQIFYKNQVTGDDRKYTFGLRLILSEKYKTIMYVNEDTLFSEAHKKGD